MTSSNASLILGLFCTQCVRQVIAINGLIRLPRLHVPDQPPCWGGKMVFMEKDSLTFENNFCWPVEEFLLIENDFCQQLIAFYWAVTDAAIADTDADRNDCSTIIVAWGLLFLGEVLQAQPGLHGLSEAGSSPCHRRVPIPGFHITRSNKLPKVKCPMSFFIEHMCWQPFLLQFRARRWNCSSLQDSLDQQVTNHPSNQPSLSSCRLKQCPTAWHPSGRMKHVEIVFSSSLIN